MYILCTVLMCWLLTGLTWLCLLLSGVELCVSQLLIRDFVTCFLTWWWRQGWVGWGGGDGGWGERGIKVCGWGWEGGWGDV